jgi:TonB-linked SusC/RagA family outer membrane protein
MKRTLFGKWCVGLSIVVAALCGGAGALAAQNAVIRGTVRSDGGDPVAGANVLIVELSAQAATNDAGRYVLTIPGDRVRGQQLQLRVRAIGYRPSSRTVTITAGEQSADFTLAQDINRLEEIVVTGVMEGTEAARVPFALSRVDMADVPAPSVDPLRMLAGRVPGANITSGSGRPGSSPAVILRGPTSINASGRGQQPLYIVDGVIVNGSLPDINPNDIENVEVVKGAAASSLYGARAGNGVIQITTRSGSRAADGLTMNVRFEAGTSDIEREFPLAQQTSIMTDYTGTRFCNNHPSLTVGLCDQTISWPDEAARINNVPGDFAISPVTLPLDPQAVFGGQTWASSWPLRNAYQAQRWPGRVYSPVQQAVLPQTFGQTTVDLTGRWGQTQVYSSFGYVKQAGAIRYLEGYQRYSGRLNVDQTLGDMGRLSLRTYVARANADGYDQDGGGTAFFRLTRVPAIANIMQTDTLGRLYVRTNIQSQGSQNENPLISLSMIEDNSITDRFLGGLTWQYTPATWALFEVNGSYDLQQYTQDYFRDKGYRVTSSTNTAATGFVRQYAAREQGYNFSGNLTMRQRLSRSIALRYNLRALYEQQDFMERQGSGATLGAVGVPTLNNATTGQAIVSYSQSIRQVGLFGGVNADFMDGRYIVEGLVRRDGTSLFGSDNRWATFGRASLAWRMSAEPWWFGGNFLNDLKLRASRGSAGGRPNFVAQYETFGITTTGPTLQNQGNKELRPEITVENELGADMELFRRVGVQLTRAWSETSDQILLVTLPAEKGFGQQWRNAGTMANNTWELAVNLPLIARRNVNWTWGFTYDRTRTTVSQLDVPPFTFGPATINNTNVMFFAREGERYGTFYGRRFARSCAELPAPFNDAAHCGGSNTEYQLNNEGYLVWVGAGNSYRDGITRNLWQTQQLGCVNSTTGAAQACNLATSTVLTPWGVNMNFGMPIIVRDTACIANPSASCSGFQQAVGTALPDWSFSVSQTFNYRRLTVYALLQGVMGREVWNQGWHWSHLDFITADVDQRNVAVEEAKPIGYYWRSPPADGFNGTGGFYDNLFPNSHTTETASYAKMRELAVSYNVGPLRGFGNWTVSAIGRNLFTITDYRGFDPEVGQTGGQAACAAINANDSFTFPNLRTFTFALSTTF